MYAITIKTKSGVRLVKEVLNPDDFRTRKTVTCNSSFDALTFESRREALRFCYGSIAMRDYPQPILIG